MNSRPFNVTVDVAAAGSIVASIAGYLPAIAALAAIIWYGVQIWESKTVQRHVRRLRMARLRKRIAARALAKRDAEPS